MPVNLLAWYLTHGVALIVEAIVVVMVKSFFVNLKFKLFKGKNTRLIKLASLLALSQGKKA